MIKCFFVLLIAAAFLSCTGQGSTEKRNALESELQDINSRLAEAGDRADYRPGMIHNVFFWLRDDLSTADEAAFLVGLKSLEQIQTVKALYIGPPAATADRDVVDHSFSYALLVYFDDVAGQNAYQTDPVHLKFVEDQKDKWTRVVVYDNALVEN